MTATLLDRPPAGWFILDVMKAGGGRRWEWLALMIDVDRDELKHCLCKTAFLWVHPNEYKPGTRTAQEAWVRIPGKYRDKEAAWDALEEQLETRHSETQTATASRNAEADRYS
jgi:hypothetical protein